MHIRQTVELGVKLSGLGRCLQMGVALGYFAARDPPFSPPAEVLPAAFPGIEKALPAHAGAFTSFTQVNARQVPTTLLSKPLRWSHLGGLWMIGAYKHATETFRRLSCL